MRDERVNLPNWLSYLQCLLILALLTSCVETTNSPEPIDTRAYPNLTIESGCNYLPQWSELERADATKFALSDSINPFYNVRKRFETSATASVVLSHTQYVDRCTRFTEITVNDATSSQIYLIGIPGGIEGLSHSARAAVDALRERCENLGTSRAIDTFGNPGVRVDGGFILETTAGHLGCETVTGSHIIALRLKTPNHDYDVVSVFGQLFIERL